jgi:putative hydrolase of the HAD superfamily
MKIVFDLGGVAIQWIPKSFITDLCGQNPTQSNLDQAFDAVFQNFSVDSDWSQFDCNKLTIQQLAALIHKRLNAYELERYVSEKHIIEWISFLPRQMLPIEETLEWLEQLRSEGIPLYFLSNMPQPFVPSLLFNDRLFSKFDDGIFSCDIGFAKPFVKIFEIAAERFNFTNGDRVIFIDDHIANVEAARKFGWHAIHHLSVQQSRQALRQFI